MIELSKHIEILLLSNDCVIVPDFGGFMAHHVEAKYDKEEGIFLPPQRVIGFNPKLKMNDSLLVQSYIEAYDLRYPEALEKIEDEVNEIRQHLENEGKYEFTNIGTLSLNEEGNYIFEPNNAGLLTPDFYGLCAFSMSEISAVQTVAMPVVNEDTKAEETQEHVTATTDDSETVEENSDDNGFVRIKLTTIRNTIAAAAAVIIALIMIVSPISENGNNKSLLSRIDTGMLAKLMPKDMTATVSHNVQAADSRKQQVETLQKSSTQPESTDSRIKNNNAEETKISATQENVSSVTPGESYYTIVLASRIPADGASKYVRQLRKKGYMDADILKEKGRHIKVTYGQYSSRSAAQHELNKLNDNNDDFSDCWIMQVQPD